MPITAARYVQSVLKGAIRDARCLLPRPRQPMHINLWRPEMSKNSDHPIEAVIHPDLEDAAIVAAGGYPRLEYCGTIILARATHDLRDYGAKIIREDERNRELDESHAQASARPSGY